MPVPEDILAVDLVLMVVTALVCVPVFRAHGRLCRVEGAAFLTRPEIGCVVAVLVAGRGHGVASLEYSVRMGLPPLRRVA